MHCTTKMCKKSVESVHLSNSVSTLVEMCQKEKGWLHFFIPIKMPRAGRELMTGCAFRWGSVLPQRRREAKQGGGKEEKQVNNRCDRINRKIWKKAKIENANDCVGDHWWSGEGVETRGFCSNQNDLLRGGWGGGIWRCFILTICTAWEIFVGTIPSP